jgi:hypothetical protein
MFSISLFLYKCLKRNQTKSCIDTSAATCPCFVKTVLVLKKMFVCIFKAWCTKTKLFVFSKFFWKKQLFGISKLSHPELRFFCHTGFRVLTINDSMSSMCGEWMKKNKGPVIKQNILYIHTKFQDPVWRSHGFLLSFLA